MSEVDLARMPGVEEDAANTHEQVDKSIPTPRGGLGEAPARKADRQAILYQYSQRLEIEHAEVRKQLASLAACLRQASCSAGDQQELQKADSLREQLQDLQAERSVLTSRLEEALNQLTDLKGEQRKFTEEWDSLQAQLDKAYRRLSQVALQRLPGKHGEGLHDSQAGKSGLQARLDGALVQLADLESEQRTLSEGRDRLTSQLDSGLQTLAKLQLTCDIAELERTKSPGKDFGLHERLRQLEADRAEVQALRASLAGCHRKSSDQASDRHIVQKAQTKHRKQLQALQEERSGLQSRLQVALNQLTDLGREQRKASQDRARSQLHLDLALRWLDRLEARFGNRMPLQASQDAGGGVQSLVEETLNQLTDLAGEQAAFSEDRGTLQSRLGSALERLATLDAIFRGEDPNGRSEGVCGCEAM